MVIGFQRVQNAVQRWFSEMGEMGYFGGAEITVMKENAAGTQRIALSLINLSVA